ncbi:MAG: hypothetical protein ABIJ43_04825 [Candidatus Beckwithbacteria bacterium]
MKKIRLAILVLLIILVVYRLNQINKTDFLANRFPEGYSSKAIKHGKNLVVYAESLEECSKNPLVYLISEGGIKSVFKISIEDFCVINDKFIFFDDLIISEWIGHAFGSGGFRGLILWKIIDGELQAVGGYPNDEDMFRADTLITVTNENNHKQQLTYPLGGMNAYSTYQLNKPLELRYANMIWDPIEESHSEPHRWSLNSFIYKDGKFIRNQNWNNGEVYITKEKIEGWGNEVGEFVDSKFETK